MEASNTHEAFARITLDDTAPAATVRPAAAAYEWPADTDASIIGSSEQAKAPISPTPDTITLENARSLLEELGVWNSHYERMHNSQGKIDVYALLSASRVLHSRGKAMMPDGRCPFRVKADDDIAVFALPPEGLYPVTYRSVTMTVVYLAAWLIQNDGASSSDIELIDNYISRSMPKGRSPLPQQAMLRWLLSRKRILSRRVKNRAVKQMARFVHKRAEALDLLMELVADSVDTSVRRVKNLETLLPLFGIDGSEVHSRLHQFVTSRKASAAKPRSMSKSATALDTQLLSAIEAETLKARDMLNDVFAQESETGAAKAVTSTKKESIEISLLRILAAKQVWPRDEFAAECSRFGIVANVALENLNELSYETTEAPVVEDEGDEIIVDTDIANSLITPP